MAVEDTDRDLIEMIRVEVKEFRALRDGISRSWERWEHESRERNRVYDVGTKRHERLMKLAWIVNAWFILVTIIVLNWISKHP